MPLSSYTIRTDKVRLDANNDFEVRGATLPDIAFLVQERLPDMIAVVAKYQEARDETLADKRPTQQTMGELAVMVARDFPNLALEMISLCIVGETVDAKTREKIATLPIPVQLDAISKIVKLSTEEAGGLGNLLSGLRQRLQDATAGEASPMAPLGA